jgi:hypothetical protein
MAISARTTRSEISNWRPRLTLKYSDGSTRGACGKETTKNGILEIHRRFTSLLPDDLRWVKNPTPEREYLLCRRGAQSRRCGRPPRCRQPGALPRFMRRFEERYSGLGTFETILAAGPRTTVSFTSIRLPMGMAELPG